MRKWTESTELREKVPASEGMRDGGDRAGTGRGQGGGGEEGQS